MDQALVTVIIPTFNRVDLLRQTLASVSAQTLAPARVIVIDDGSRDGTGELLRDSPVEVVANPNGGWGPARARGEGLRRAETELVAFLDDDDLLLPGALERLAAALVEAPTAPFAFGRSLTACQDGRGWRPTGVIEPSRDELAGLPASLFARNFVPSVGSMARRTATDRIGGYPAAVRRAEDHYFWIELARLGDPVFVPRVTSIYREHDGGRHDPTRVGAEQTAFARLAAEDRRLTAALPERLGVQLCETLTPALRAHDPGAALAALRGTLGASPARLTTLRRAVGHWRRRRSRRPELVLGSDPEVGATLDRYPWPEPSASSIVET